MKVRISGNSIRYRLKQSEVKQFEQEGEIREITSFGTKASDKLSFILRKGSSANFSVTYQSNIVLLQVPPLVCTEWTATEMVGFEQAIEIDKGETIKILVEKDFKCLDGSDLENEDAFPNPNVHC